MANVVLGYACLSVPMRKKDIFCSRTLTLKSLEKKGIAEAKRLAKLNIADMIKIIKYNESVGLRFWRLTSNLFPHMENPRAMGKYDLSFAKKDLATAGNLARQYGHRITMHPGQFAQLGSPRAEVVAQTFKDLTLHAKVLEYMGLTPEKGSVLIIHGGGSFGDKHATLARWEANFHKLPEHVRRYISLENDDYQYTVLDLLPMCERNGIPLCIDFFHHECLGQDKFDIFDPVLIQRVMNTWKLRGIKPKCHWSNQKPGARKGSHSDCVKDIPKKILKVCAENNCDIMLECKQKDLCTLEIYKKHFNRVDNNGRVEYYLKNIT